MNILINKKGFTLIEFLIYTVIVVFFIGSLTTMAVNALNARVKVTSMERVIRSAELAVDNITDTIRNAKGVNSTGEGAIELEVDPDHDNPTIFALDDGKIVVTRGSKDPVSITGEKVEVTSLSFTNPTSRMVEIEMTIEHINPQGLLSYEYSGTFRTKENIRIIIED